MQTMQNNQVGDTSAKARKLIENSHLFFHSWEWWKKWGDYPISHADKDSEPISFLHIPREFYTVYGVKCVGHVLGAVISSTSEEDIAAIPETERETRQVRSVEFTRESGQRVCNITLAMFTTAPDAPFTADDPFLVDFKYVGRQWYCLWESSSKWLPVTDALESLFLFAAMAAALSPKTSTGNTIGLLETNN